MALDVGSRLGPYEIAAKIGEGGMGEVYQLRRNMMDRHTRLLLIGAALLAIAVWLTPVSFSQADPFAGTWQLNLGRSSYDPGPPPKSLSLIVEGEGHERKATLAGIDAAGNPFEVVYTFIHDSQPHEVTGSPRWDMVIYTPIDGNTISWTVTKGGQVVMTGTDTVSHDGTTFTITETGVDANGQPVNNSAVFDKQ